MFLYNQKSFSNPFYQNSLHGLRIRSHVRNVLVRLIFSVAGITAADVEDVYVEIVPPQSHT